MDRATANLPSADLDRTAAFYTPLGFTISFKDDGWMILDRGAITLEFFPVAVDPRTTTGSACLRVDDLDRSMRTSVKLVGCLDSAGPRRGCCRSAKKACGCSCLSIRTVIFCAAATIFTGQPMQAEWHPRLR